MKPISMDVRRRGRVALAIIAGLVASTLLTACSSSDRGTGPSRDPAGTYVLRMVDDDQLPAVIHHGPWFDPVNRRFHNQLLVQIRGGRAELHNDESFNITVDIAYVGDGVPGSSIAYIAGYYAIQNGEIVFEPEDTAVPPLLGSLEKGALSLAIDFMSKGRDNIYSFAR